MPRYFLHHVLGDARIEDGVGFEVDALAEAECLAVMSVRRIIGHHLIAGGAIPDGQVEITDAAGKVLSIIRHDAALRPS